MKTLNTSLFSFVVVLCLVPATQAQDMASSSPYSYSGPCASEGSWTRAALAQTTELKSVIAKLKDNPGCSALKNGLESSFSEMQKNLSETENLENSANGKGQKLNTLPQEISALRTFSRENSAFKGNVLKALLGKSLTYSALASQQIGGNKGSEQSDELISSLGRRVKNSTYTGLQLFNSTVSLMEQAKANCLDDTQGVSLAAGMVKILSSFAGSSSSANMGSQMAVAVQNLGHYFERNKKYVDSLRKLNDREFTTSMSCLLEVTTDGYCNALDAKYLFQEIMKSQSVKVETFINKETHKKEQKAVGINTNFSTKLQHGPLAGYYILSQQLPVITAWLSKVQYGITPQLPTEAEFQVGVSKNVYNHYNMVKRIQGMFNFQAQLIKDIPDFKAKQTYVLGMLNNVAGAMSNRDGDNAENFFLKVASSNEMFYRLIDMPVPPAVLGSGPEGIQFVNNPNGYLNVKYRDLPIFSDPDKLVELISKKMNDLFEESTQMAIAYYNKYFIVDKDQVVNDSLVGLQVNVRDALINIDQYLEALGVRVKQAGNDPTMYASIVDTRERIGRIISRYRELHDYSKQLIDESEKVSKGNSDTDPELKKKLRTVGNTLLRTIGESLLQQVYTDLQILTARTGFLSNRIATFVYLDYTMSLRSRDQFTPYIEDLMLATGYNTLNGMVGMSQIELSKVKTDLDQALNINKVNIDSLEQIVEAGFVRRIFDLKLMSTNKEINEENRAWLAYVESQKIGSAQIPGEDSNVVQRYIRGKLNRIKMYVTGDDTDKLGAPNWAGKLAFPFKNFAHSLIGTKGKIVVSPVSEFDTAASERGKLCTQTLAFANLRTYWELCADTQLDSPMMQKDVTEPELKKLLNNYLSVNYVVKAQEHMAVDKEANDGLALARNYQARICALRDYHRRNEVARMTSGMRADGQEFQNEFTGTIAPPPTTETTPAPSNVTTTPTTNENK